MRVNGMLPFLNVLSMAGSAGSSGLDQPCLSRRLRHRIGATGEPNANAEDHRESLPPSR